MEEETLATEMLHEIKANAKRWFIVSVIEAIIIFAIFISVLIYESQYETVTDETQTIEDIDNSQNSSYTQSIR